ncbi:MAG: hypothetical protein AAF376_07355, partial [Pseudomonadota bacterium]
MTKDLAKFAAKNDVKYFMISFTDLFGGQRAKLVPAQAIADMQEDGAGFAGFATWLDMTPAHPDMLGLRVAWARSASRFGRRGLRGGRGCLRPGRAG